MKQGESETKKEQDGNKTNDRGYGKFCFSVYNRHLPSAVPWEDFGVKCRGFCPRFLPGLESCPDSVPVARVHGYIAAHASAE